MSSANSFIPWILFGFALIIYITRLVKKRRACDESYKQHSINPIKVRKTGLDYYAILIRIPLISGSLNSIKTGLYIVMHAEERELREKATEIFVKSVIFAGILLLLMIMFIERSLYNMFISFLISILIFDSLVLRYIRKNDIILEQLPEAINDLKHHFSSEKTVEKAYLNTIKSSPPEIGMHLNKILEILKEPYEKAKGSLKRYNDECHNKYLKILNAYSFLTKEYGDIEKNGESMFNVNMNYLIAEIRNEYRKKRIINSTLFGQKFFALLPLIALPALKQYLLKYMELPELREYYNSSFGYLSFIACWFVTIFCYMLYCEIAKTDEREKKVIVGKKTWEDLLFKMSLVRNIISKLTPNISSEKYQRILKKMIRAGNLQKVEWFYLKKALLAVAAFVILFSVMLVAKHINVKYIYEDVTYGMNNRLLALTEIEKDSERREIIFKNDRKIIRDLKQMKSDRETDPAKLKQYIELSIKKLRIKGLDSKVDSQRIYNKIVALKKINAKHIDILVILIISWLSYFVPNVVLALSSITQSFAMQDEVMGFQTVILLLMYHERITVETILDWLIWFSDIFKVQLIETKNNLNDRVKGGIKALQKLKNDVKFKPMQHVVHNLILAQAKLNLIEAFSGLEHDQKFNLELRKDNTELIIKTKIMLATRIVSFSTGFCLITYLVIPLLYSAYSLLISILNTAGI